MPPVDLNELATQRAGWTPLDTIALLEGALAARGFSRRKGEPLQKLLRRARRQMPDVGLLVGQAIALRLYDREMERRGILRGEGESENTWRLRAARAHADLDFAIRQIVAGEGVPVSLIK